jgi:protein arginine kinase activator
MLCSCCKQNEATVHLTQIVGDKIQKVDLCEGCSKEKGVSDPKAFALADVLLGLGASQEMAEATAGIEVKCPQCGFTQAEFKKSGRLGCAECYTTFAEGLEGLLKSMHKGTQHVGKAPESIRQTRDLSEKLKSLQKRLDKAVHDEDFELAATLRDELKQARQRLTEITST